MPFGDESFCVLVFDPPHIPNQGRDQQKDFCDRFGLGEKSGAATKYSLSHLYPPFCREAYRVLRPEGVLLAKIADYVHNHRTVWAHLDFVEAAKAGRVHPLRHDRQGAQRPDRGPEVEDGPPRPTAALLLDHLPDVEEV
jgi:hypothetical protein